MKKTIFILAVVGILALPAGVFAGNGHQGKKGQDNPGQCVRAATYEYNQCKADCQDLYFTEKDACRKIDPVCAEQCRVTLVTCVAPYQEALDACFGGCSEALGTSREACRTIPDPVLQQQCLGDAEMANWLCRDTCRVSVYVDGKWWRQGVMECRRAARACFKACPSLPK